MEHINGARIYGVPKKVAIATDVLTDIDGKEIKQTVEAIRRLTEAGFQVDREVLVGNPKGNELARRLRDAQVDVVMPRTSMKFDREVLENSGISALAAACVEPDFDLSAAMDLGVAGFNAHQNSQQVYQLTKGEIFSFSAGIVRGTFSTREDGRFEKKKIGGANFAISDVRLGVIGAGVIGKKVLLGMQQEGAQVAFCNDRSDRDRQYDRELDKFAHENGIQRMHTAEQLAEWANILTIHAGPRNHREEANTGMIDSSILAALCKNPDPLRGAYLINNARLNLMGVSADEINRLLAEGKLAGFATDVFEKTQEQNPKTFVNPYSREHDVATTPHIGGSNDVFVGLAAQEAAAQLIRWAQTGSHNDSLITPRDSVDVSPAAGQLVLDILRSTDHGTLARISAVLDKNGFNQVMDGKPTTGETVPGTRISRPVASHVFVNDNARSDTGRFNGDYSTVLKDVVGELCALNTPEKRIIRRIRPIATDDTQRQALENIRFAPNLLEV